MVSKARREQIRKQYRIWRTNVGKTQYEVEQEARLLAGRYWKIENGFHDPDDDERKQLARALRISASDIPALASMPTEIAS